jgi:hypothetical protein
MLEALDFLQNCARLVVDSSCVCALKQIEFAVIERCEGGAGFCITVSPQF